MIQDIAPYRLRNEYKPGPCRIGDKILSFDDEGRLAAAFDEEGIVYPSVTDAFCPQDMVYLFSVAGHGYYMTDKEIPDYEYYSVRNLRERGGGCGILAAFTGYHLWKWYRDSRFCGKCGGATVRDDMERAMKCTICGNMIYPRINPAVIVGVINGDSLLITRYRSGYTHNALVAGFTEIGETLEETVEREVMEEAGIRVRNIRYYKSQPWGIAMDVLAGFYCDAADTDIRMDNSELKYAQWTRREDIVLQPDDLSLTNEMMRMFRDGKVR